jgi:DNA (cytosine-5)-methyltransferase 1
MSRQTELQALIERLNLPLEDVAARIGCHVSTLYRWLRGRVQPRRAVLEYIRQLTSIGVGALQPAQFDFIDLFAGIGGMRLGARAAGGRCVYTVEWDDYARKTYCANFKDAADHPFDRDIRDVDIARIPQHDLLLAGFPCQPFSIAGVSKKNALGRPHGFDCEEQGNLFFNIADLLAYHRPSAFLLENVRNLKSHDSGRTFKRIMGVLEQDLRYHVQTRIIDASRFVPQHRERIFIIGFKAETGFDFSKLELPTTGPKLGTILHRESEIEEPPYTMQVNGRTVAHKKYTLTAHLWTYLKNYAAKHRAMGNGFGYGKVTENDIARTLSARYYKDGSEILVDRGNGRRPRRLTPRECARLMGFDQPGRPRFEIPVSDTRAYKQFGNAVVVPVVEAVVRYMLPFILQAKGGEQLPLPLPEVPESGVAVYA